MLFRSLVEIIRTQVQPATGAKVTGVTVTRVATGATTPIAESPAGSSLYPEPMPGEDIIITVHFGPDGSDPDHPEIFRADVNLTGAVDPGNTATIQNVSRSDLSDGTIWASGYPDNGMKVNVTVAPGYKVTVSVINTTTGASLGTSAIWGSGLPITTANFDIDFKMPDLPDTQIGRAHV